MPKNDIGGFFVSLGLNIDRNSFDTGNKLIDSVGNSFNRLIGSARNAAVVLAGTAVATGAIESQAGKLAEEIGISTEALDLWKATAKIAGADANGLVSAMAGIATVLQRMDIDGAGLEELTKHLGELGVVSNEKIDIEKLLNLSPDELVREVLDISHRALTNGANKQDVQQIVKDIIGKEGEKLFIDLERRGLTITQALNEAQKTVFTTVEDNEKGQGFNTEVNLLKTEFQSISKLFGDSIAGELTPYLQDWNKWIQDNREDIKEAVQAVSIVVGKVADYIVDTSKRLVMDEDQTSDASTLNSILDNKRSFNFKENGIFGGLKEGLFGDADYSLLNEKEKEMVATYYKKYQTLTGLNIKNVDRDDVRNRANKQQEPTQNKVTTTPKKTNNKNWWEESEAQYDRSVKDGIIKPDGTITKVAPDDWVFAARNIGDMARAFIPQNHTAVSTGEYTINQTFNINGGNDMPQVIRQQAYRGTQEGLLELMNESSRRMQLMSGIR